MYYQLKNTIFFFNKQTMVIFNWVVSDNGVCFSFFKYSEVEFNSYLNNIISCQRKKPARELTENEFLEFESVVLKLIENSASLTPVSPIDQHILSLRRKLNLIDEL